MKDKSSFIRVARLFVIIGAILMIVLGLLSVVGRVLSLPFYPQAGLASVSYIIMSLVGGFAALVLSPRTGAFPWNLLLIVIGIVGGGLGGLLVLIGGVTALITRLT